MSPNEFSTGNDTTNELNQTQKLNKVSVVADGFPYLTSYSLPIDFLRSYCFGTSRI